MIFESWRQLTSKVSDMTEEELLVAINMEVSTYGRKPFIERMHQRYSKLRVARERDQLCKKEILL